MLPSGRRVKLHVADFVEVAVVRPSAEGDLLGRVRVVESYVGVEGDLLWACNSQWSCSSATCEEERTLMDCFFENWMLMRCGCGPSLLWFRVSQLATTQRRKSVLPQHCRVWIAQVLDAVPWLGA